MLTEKTASARSKAGPRPETFLQFVAVKLMGPPKSAGRRWYWPCPVCSHSTAFSTLPHDPQHKDRVRCFRCAFKGDAADLLKEFMPGKDWPTRQAQLEQWRAEFDALPPGPGTRGRPSTHSPSGNGERRRRPSRVYDADPQVEAFSPEADAAAAELIELAGGDPHDPATREKLLHFQQALEVCGQHALHPLGLAVRVGFAAWAGETDAEHLAECNDPECDYHCCRLARGWTAEEIQTAVEADTKSRKERRPARRAGHQLEAPTVKGG